MDVPRFFPRRYSTPELAMRKHALKYQRDDNDDNDEDDDDEDGQSISNKSCQTDLLGLDKYLQRSPPKDVSLNSTAAVAKTTLRAYKKLAKKPKVRSVAVHCERRRLTLAAFKGCQKFKHVYRRKVSLPHPSSATTTTSDDCRRDSGVLPKLRPDRTETDTLQRPTAAKSGPALKLPRIPTRDAKPELPDRTDDSGGGGTRLARLTRPQSTGSGSGSGSCDRDRKLAYFRANSAPRIDSRYYTLQMATPPAAQPSSERERSTTPGSSDTADTTLDMSFVRRLQPADDDDVATTTATEASTSNTRTVSTSTTFTEPVFPIVFSCESVLRHPLDGGYVSHTESHRFSVHYVPVEDVRTAAACTDTDDGSRSSLVFTSAGACQNERCLTGDSISVTVGGKSMTDDSMASQSTSTNTTTTTGERRLVIEHLNSDVQFKNVTRNNNVKNPIVREPSSDYILPVDDENNNAGKTSENGKNNVKMEGFYVLGKGDTTTTNRHENDFEKTTPPTPACNKIIDTFGNAVEEREGDGTVVRLKSHAHTDDMPLQQSNERNYERLTQNNQVDSTDRTVSNQSPKFDGTETQPGVEIEQQNDLESDGNDSSHANEIDQSCVYVEPINQLTAEQTKQSTNVKPLNRSPNFELKNQPIDVEANNQPTNTVEPIKQSTKTVELTKQLTNTTEPTEQLINVEVIDVEPTKQPENVTTDLQVDPIPENTDIEYLTVPFDYSYENTEEMSQCRKHHCEKNGKRGTERKMHSNNSQCESAEKRHAVHTSVKRNLPNRLYDNMSRKRDDDQDRDRHQHISQNPHNTAHFNTTAHSSNTINHETIDRRTEHIDGKRVLGYESNQAGSNVLNKKTHQNVVDKQHHGLLGNRLNDSKHKVQSDMNHRDYDTERHGTDSRRHANANVRTEPDNKSSCHRCTNSLSHKNYETKHEVEGHHSLFNSGNSSTVESKDHHNYRNSDNGKNLISKRRLESVDESTETTKESNYIGGFLFGDAFNKKQPQKLHETDNEQNECSKYSYYDDSKKVNFSLKPNDHKTYGYYENYAPKTRHSPRDEDCTVFADVPTRNTNQGCAQSDRYSTAQTSYYSQLDDKNTDSDESLTDSLEDCKYEGAAISYFLALNGQKSAVTFTLKMPNTLQSRLNRRKSQLKKHLHVSTTVRKIAARVRTRHKGCQTLWTEEKGVQVQRGSTADARKPVVDDHKVLTTLLAGLDRNRVSENQIRVVGGQKMVSEGNQTERPAIDRHTQTLMTKDVAAGPGTPENNTVATGTQCRGQQLHAAKKFSSDNALMVGVVRQNKYKGKEALDGAKNDQLLTLSKGWINFYTLRADSADTDAHGNKLD